MSAIGETIVLDNSCLSNKADEIYMNAHKMLADEIRNKCSEYIIIGGKGG